MSTRNSNSRLVRAISRLQRPGTMLRVLRIVVSLTMLAITTVMFTTGEAALAVKLGWAARIQLVPLVFAGATAGLLAWVVVTIIFGRIYCSTVCPMGTLQDIAAHSRRSGKRWKSRRPYHYTPGRPALRLLMLALFAGCALVGLMSVTDILDPYSAYGRIDTELLLPATRWLTGNPVAIASWLAFGVAAATLSAVWVVAALRGRQLCNTVCPVGSTLGLFSRFSLFHFDIDTDLCTNCRSCERVCKASCINLDDHVVEGSRCVTCFNCIDACPASAISYTTRHKRLSIPMLQRVGRGATAAVDTTTRPLERQTATHDTRVKISRRQFMKTGLILAAGTIPAVAIAAKAIGGDTRQATPQRLRPVAPPGRRSMHDFLASCTACGLCVAHCPTGVLKPSAGEYGWSHAMQPLLRFDTACCAYDCTACTDLCPTGALSPLTVDEKHIFIIGNAEVDQSRCVGCGRCEKACPRQAISMVATGGNRRRAVVDTSLCIGCGACQQACPVKPEKAIRVNGII